MNYIKKTIAMGDKEIVCISISDESSMSLIPLDPANTDYQAYLAWVAEGNTAEEWEGM